MSDLFAELDPRVNPVLAVGTGAGRPPFVPGVFHDMPGATYHSIEAVGSSGAKKLLRSAAHYLVERTTAATPNAAMQFGTAVHAGVLEPDTFERTVAIKPDVDGRTKAGRAELDAFYDGLEEQGRVDCVILAPADYDRVRRCVDAVRAHAGARRLLDGARHEVSLFWNDERYAVPCKARLDAINHGGLIDLKTTTDASPPEFARSIVNFLYHVQAAHYARGAEVVLGERPTFFAFIAVETAPPHAVACYVLREAALDVGARLVATALERYAEAMRSGDWRAYPETIDVIELPAYAMRTW